MQSCLVVPKNFRLGSIRLSFIIKLPNRRELQQIEFNHLSDIGFQEFMNLYRKCTAKQYLF